MLDWTLIDNDKVFQRLVNHIFALECNSPGFIPSSPYIGADGGWDGAYEGNYEGLKGAFSIQAKWTKKNFNDAAYYLKAEINDEIKKALNNDVDHLRIATNAELRKKHVSDLESLKPPNLQTLNVWHREALSLKIEKQPFIRYYFFGKPQFPTFVPSNIYMASIESKLLQSQIFGRLNELMKVEDSLIFSGINIAILHSAGGHGKSHFLKSLSEEINEKNDAKQVWFIRSGIRPLQDAVQDELISGREYIIFLDDADRFIEDVRALISIIRFEKNIKAVFSCRSAGLSLLKDELLRQRSEEHTIHELLVLPDEELEKILCEAAEETTINKSRQVVTGLNRNPYLIVQYGRRYKGEVTDKDLEKIYERLNDDLIYDVNQILMSDLEKNQQIKLLKHIASIVPFQITEQFLQKLSELLDISKGKIKGSIEKLISGRILRSTGENVRFDPDMIGDLFLSIQLNQDPALSEDLIEKWFPLTPMRLIANISSAFPYGKIDSIPKILGNLVNKWISHVKDHGQYKRTENLKNIRPACTIVPNESLNLIYSYLSNQIPNGESKYSITLDNYGPIIESISLHPDYQIETLELIKELKEREISGQYDNYKPDTLLKTLVSPLRKTPGSIEEVLSRLIEWCESQSLSETQAQMATVAASEILSAAHEYRDFLNDKVTFGMRVLRCTAEVEKLRDLSLTIFKILIGRRDSRKFLLLALKIAESIGESRMGHIDENKIPLAQRIANDRGLILKSLEGLQIGHFDLVVLSKLEDLLFEWWSMKKRGADRALQILIEIPRSPEYRFFKRFTDPEFLIDDMDELLNEVPKEGIWNWWWDNKEKSRWNQDLEALKRLAEELSKKYVTADEILEFLINMEEIIAPHHHYPYPQILKYWVELEHESFLELSNDFRWQKIPLRFKGQISSGLAKYQIEHVSEVEKEIISSLPNTPVERLYDFVTLISENSIPYKEVRSSFFNIAERGSVQIRGNLIFQCYFLLREMQDKDALFEIIFHAIQGPTDHQFIHNLAFSIRGAKDWPIKNSGLAEKLKEKIISLAISFKRLEHNEIEIIRFCLDDDLNSWINFIQKRYELAKERQALKQIESNIEVIPYNGIKYIKNTIKSYSDFKEIMLKVIEWDEDETWLIDSNYLLRPLKSLDFKNGNEFFSIWIKEKLDEEDETAYKIVLKFISFFGIRMLEDEIICKILETGLELDLFERVKSTFRRALGTGDDFGWEDAIHYNYSETEALCERLIDKCGSGQIGFFLRQYVQSLK